MLLRMVGEYGPRFSMIPWGRAFEDMQGGGCVGGKETTFVPTELLTLSQTSPGFYVSAVKVS